MKPEHFLLLQISAFQDVYNRRIIESLLAIQSKLEHDTPEEGAPLNQLIMDHIHTDCENHFKLLIDKFQRFFEEQDPNISRLTPEELILILSQQKPGE